MLVGFPDFGFRNNSSEGACSVPILFYTRATGVYRRRREHNPPRRELPRPTKVEICVDESRINTVMQNMGGVLAKVAEATALLLDNTTWNLVSSAVVEQRGKAQEIRRASGQLQEVLRLLDSNQ